MSQSSHTQFQFTPEVDTSRDEVSAKAERKGPRPPSKRMRFKQLQMALSVQSAQVRNLRQKENDFKDREMFG
jgi:hypothetical protein